MDGIKKKNLLNLNLKLQINSLSGFHHFYQIYNFTNFNIFRKPEKNIEIFNENKVFLLLLFR